MTRVVAVILAAGTGERLGSQRPKAFLRLGNQTMLETAVGSVAACSEVDSLVVAVPPQLVDRAEQILGADGRLLQRTVVVAGGETRHRSMALALEAVDRDAELILCHDAARPFASPALFSAVLGALRSPSALQGVVPVVLIPDTVKRVQDGTILRTEPRDELVLAQTPQVFLADALRDAHEKAAAAGLEFTDDAALMEWAGYQVGTVPGEPGNFKVTTAADLARAERAVEEGAPR